MKNSIVTHAHLHHSYNRNLEDTMLNTSEIFSSLQGESLTAGYPTTFVRLFGCPMRCTYCDTMYAVVGKKYKSFSIKHIVNVVTKMRNEHVCITGGEPLFQDDVWTLIYELCEKGYKVSIETNGGVEIEEQKTRSFRYVMDIKGPSSGMSHLNIYENLSRLNSRDEVKFVVGDREDFDFVLDVIKKYPTPAPIVVSPLFRGKKSTIMQDLAEWVMEEKIPNLRMGVQLHKIIGVQ